MADDLIRYDRLVENALRSVVRDVISQTAVQGLPGDHHFYLTFRTDYPGVALPPYLHDRYPSEMTIVLQHQFYGLEMQDDVIGVTLTFSNKPERLVVPLAAITVFADPSVSFALQFESTVEEDGGEEDAAPQPEDVVEEPPSDEEPRMGEVVTLDNFRKKQ